MVAHLRGHLRNTNTTEDVVAHKLWGHLQICDAIVYDEFSLMLFTNFMVMATHKLWGHLQITNTTKGVVAHKLWGHLQNCELIFKVNSVWYFSLIPWSW